MYTSKLRWTGNRGQGTKSYAGYDRNWSIETPGKQVVHCSNDPLLGGDPHLHNPEDLLISALSACHMLWYLHLASEVGIIVHGYSDAPEALGETDDTNASRFLKATLKPVIEVAPGVDTQHADQLHYEIHKVCFIARSVNFPVEYDARYVKSAE